MGGRRCSSPGAQKEKRAHEHRKIRACVAHHEPESLACAHQLRNFRGRDGRADNYKKRDGREARPQSSQYQQPANDLECSDEVRRERRVRESDASEALHAHLRVGVLEDARAKKISPTAMQMKIVPLKPLEFSRKVIELTRSRMV